ncbi:hypothetical protein M409DRAFT_54524 [Zasmidium cellare ATCC 36951]|uniref:Uncharacterized protein n=1 Tax=Zasmidium cellare ATCC 36951 TaxID=1080233 RepID=A0A6A6CJF1_ZASCE|nr:uncharacterized protein M409DRAFT_54524 [Zasmidium cellare ATCC 36951]KAF2166733.1 hypothetical protein M409DRAFT_54524 [Zasmidium cellare ATCC 36951]
MAQRQTRSPSARHSTPKRPALALAPALAARDLETSCYASNSQHNNSSHSPQIFHLLPTTRRHPILPKPPLRSVGARMQVRGELTADVALEFVEKVQGEVESQALQKSRSRSLADQRSSSSLLSSSSFNTTLCNPFHPEAPLFAALLPIPQDG